MKMCEQIFKTAVHGTSGKSLRKTKTGKKKQEMANNSPNDCFAAINK